MGEVELEFDPRMDRKTLQENMPVVERYSVVERNSKGIQVKKILAYYYRMPNPNQ